jgi:hypothetical protein
MSSTTSIAPWKSNQAVVVSDSTSSVPAIVEAALQLRDRERKQVAANIEAGHYEVATTFVWHRGMTLLKKQLATLGNDFIAELLQRPDIDANSDLTSAISESEAITLARDLGILTATQAMRLSHSQEVVNHFASVDGDDSVAEEETMTHEEAVSCLRVCVQGILGRERIDIAEDFSLFRKNLEASTFTVNSPEIVRLQQSPYFFIRTAISVLLALLKGGQGAQIEHASRNALLIIPLFWQVLKKPERWQIGRVYASEFNEGNKDAVKALHAVLMQVKGFDYVPENLRSNTFTRVASSVIAAHQGANNFYNEPAPMRELANLGSSIPGPALAICVTAALCVKLGNQYGTCWAAQASADQVLSTISKERWKYYLDDRLEVDPIILAKLTQDAPLQRWIELMGASDIDPGELSSKSAKDLLTETKAKRPQKVAAIAKSMQSKM